MPGFHVELASVLDLFYDQTTDPEYEYLELCGVLESDTGFNILDSVYQQPMNRGPFTRYAMKTTGVDTKTASEIFSCATNCFSAAGSESPKTGNAADLPDTDMTKDEFAHGTVMLANIFALMHNENGTRDASKLSGQMIAFLSEVRNTYESKSPNQSRK